MVLYMYTYHVHTCTVKNYNTMYILAFDSNMPTECLHDHETTNNLGKKIAMAILTLQKEVHYYVAL